MSLPQKRNTDTADRPLDNLPELPSLPSLTAAENEALNTFWLRVREILVREDQVIRDLIQKTNSG